MKPQKLSIFLIQKSYQIMKNISLLSIFIICLNSLFAQRSLPESISKNLDTTVQNNISVNDIYEAYDRIPSLNPDSTENKDFIKASRWMHYVFSKMNIEDSVNYSLSTYNDALKDVFQGGFDCYGTDQANWTSEGPYDKDITQTSNDSHNGGWIDAIYNDPNNLDRFILGTRTSGMFETDNGGQNWHSITDQLPFPINGIRQIEPSPNNGDYMVAISGNTIVEGTVLLSFDRGNSWVLSVDGPSLNWVDYHPTIPGLIFGVSDESVYYSTDYGSNWTVFSNPVPSDYVSTHKDIFKIRVHDDKLFIISLGLEFLGYNSNGNPEYSEREKAFIYESSFSMNGSIPQLTWNQNLLNDQFHDPNNSVLFFADFSNQIGPRCILQVILDIDNVQDHKNKFYETLDYGDTYSEVAQNSSFGSDVDNDNLGRLYKNELIISPNDPDKLYWASLLSPRVINISNPTAWSGFNYVSGNSGHHVDYRCSFIINDNGKDRIVYGNDGGVGLVTDGLQYQAEIGSINGDLSINLLHAFHVHEPTKDIAYAFQDHSMRTRDMSENSYSDGFLNEGSLAFIQDIDPDAVVGENAYFRIQDAAFSTNEIVEYGFANHRLNLGGDFKVYRHHNGWFARGIKYHKNNESLDPTGGVAINRGANNSYESNIPESRRIGAIGICQRDRNVLYASEFEVRQQTQANNNHKLFKSTDGGDSWVNLDDATIDIFPGASLIDVLIWNGIRSIGVDPENPDIIYCGIGGTYDENYSVVHEKFRVIKSTNGGEDFIDYSSGLPALPIEEILTIESNTGLVFCANSIGVYYRTNTMNEWECFSNNLPNVEITDIQFDYCSNELYVSTYGRGMWKTPVPFVIENDYKKEITGTETWNDYTSLKEDLIIKNGAVLTITGTVEVAYDKKIIIEPGGKLVVDGGVLSNYCNKFWKGIEVQGNHSLSQTTTNQGYLLTMNGAVIENAKIAVNLWEHGSWSTTGGMVNAYNTTFKNNWKSFEFMPYHDFYSGSSEHPYRARIWDCDFEWTNDYESIGNLNINPAITLYDVNGVDIRGCNFHDQRDYVTKYQERATGILSLDATYRVLGKKVVTTGPAPHYYDESYYVPGVFTDMHKGVFAMNSNSQANVTVDQMKFVNSRIGIELSAVDNAMLTRNMFEFTTNHVAEIPKMNQIIMDKSSGFSVEGNIFKNSDSQATVDGVIVLNSGLEENQIYKNKYQGVYASNIAMGVNTTDLSEPDHRVKGLQWKCNDYSSRRADQLFISASAVPGDQNGVRLLQGIENVEPVGNKLTQGFSVSNGEAQFRTNDPDEVSYFYDQNEQDEVLSDYIGLIASEGQLTPKSCPSSFNEHIIGFDSKNILQDLTKNSLLDELELFKAEYKSKLTELENDLKDNNPQSLYDQVSRLDTNTWEDLHNTLKANSPYLELDLVKSLGDQSNPHYPHEWFREILLLNPEILKSSGFIDYLRNKRVPMPDNIIQDLEESRFDNISARGELLHRLYVLVEDIVEAENLLFKSTLSDTISVDWTEAKERLKSRGDHLVLQQLVDQSFGVKELDSAEVYIQELKNSSRDSEYSYISSSMKNLADFKYFVLDSLMNSDGIIDSLTDSQVSKLKYYRDKFNNEKVSDQAGNLLCYFRGDCKSVPTIDYNAKSINYSNNSMNSYESLNESDLIKVIPNPNDGKFVIELLEGEIKSIKIHSIEGKEHNFEENRISDQQVSLELSNFDPGIFIVKVFMKDGTVKNKRIIIE